MPEESNTNIVYDNGSTSKGRVANAKLYLCGRNQFPKRFYCPEDKQAYLETISGAAEYRKSLPIIGVAAGGIGMVVLSRWGDYGFSASMVPFVFFSMLVGLVAAFLLVKQVRKTENTGQGRWTPVDKLDAESMKKFLWQSRKMSLIYFLAKVIVLLLVIFAPFVIEGRLNDIAGELSGSMLPVKKQLEEAINEVEERKRECRELGVALKNIVRVYENTETKISEADVKPKYGIFWMYKFSYGSF